MHIHVCIYSKHTLHKIQGIRLSRCQGAIIYTGEPLAIGTQLYTIYETSEQDASTTYTLYVAHIQTDMHVRTC